MISILEVAISAVLAGHQEFGEHDKRLENTPDIPNVTEKGHVQ